MDDDYEHREHDHLVEPMFAGLRVERDQARAGRTRPWATWFVLIALAGIFVALLLGWI